jgi:glycerol-3-phosphate dehydrogenase subunit C
VTLDVRAAEFWDPGKVEADLRRVADICAGCRRCVGLCPSFKVMLDRVDAPAVDGDVEKLSVADLGEVVDLCYQCKLCYNHCPYTPPHRWQVDFPRLMLRARAAAARQRGVRFQDRVLGNTDLVGRLGSLTAPLSNWANEFAVHRVFLEAVAGIHRKRKLPGFHRETFGSWFTRRPPPTGGGGDRAGRPGAGRVALFATCTVEYNEPAIGRAAVRVLERNGIDVALPPQRCCGMPYLDGGAMDQARALIQENVRHLAAAARDGREIVALGPTCGYMLKQEYPWLDGSEDARLVASRTRDLFEFLARLQTAGGLDTNFVRRPGRIAYHVPCHLRAQNIGHKSADVLGALPGAEVTVIEKCSAVDGTWGFKKEYFELSLEVAQPLFDAIGASGAGRTATDCPLAALQIAQGTGRAPSHPIQILAEAYGIEAD